jgi:uncharacterized protein YxjI
MLVILRYQGKDDYLMLDQFSHSTYLVKKQVFKLFGGAFRIYDPNQNLVLFSNMKAFKLKEDIRIYTGEDMATEIITIKARKVLDISSAYDVVDATTGEKIGALKRKGLKSIIMDEWIIMDNNDNEIGLIQEDSLLFASLRRWITNLIPQNFHATIQGQQVCSFKQIFNPLCIKLNVDFTPDTAGCFDKRLGIAASVLLCAIEGRQN